MENEKYYYVYDYVPTGVTEDEQITAAKLADNYVTYGVLYNWNAAMNGATTSNANPSGVQGVCPSGWHLPSDAEWVVLITKLGGESIAGSKLKEAGNSHWTEHIDGNATNESGFTALPGGFRHTLYFKYTLTLGFWWAATETSSTAWRNKLSYNDSLIDRNSYNPKTNAYSVRCVKD